MDEELKELQDVEERKLREAVKRSMSGKKNADKIATNVNTTQLKPSSGSSDNTSSSSVSRMNNQQRNISSPTNSHKIGNNNNGNENKSKTFASSVNPMSSHLRIDNFQRPLNIQTLRNWLQERYGKEIPMENIWLNAIKTHCYVDLDSPSSAALLRELVHNVQWPDTNPHKLFADFTTVSAAEAPTHPEAQLKPGQWITTSSIPTSHTADLRIITADNGGMPLVTAEAPLSSTKRRLGAGAGAMMGVLKNAANSAALSAKTTRLATIDGNEETGFSTRKNRLDPAAAVTPTAIHASETERSTVPAKRIRDRIGTATVSKPVTEVETSRRVGSSGARSDDRKQEETVEPEPKKVKVLALEELFRKTIAVPHLFWLPVSDDVVQQRLKLRSNA